MYASSTQFILMAWPASRPKISMCATRDFGLLSSRRLTACAALASRSAFITRKVLVSGKHQRNMIMRMGGPAPNLGRLSWCSRIQSYLVNVTSTKSANHESWSAPELDRRLLQAAVPLRSLAVMGVSSEICYPQDTSLAIAATFNAPPRTWYSPDKMPRAS